MQQFKLFIKIIVGVRDYAVAFYFADLLLVLVIILFLFVEVSVEKSEGKFLKNVLKVLRYVRITLIIDFIENITYSKISIFTLTDSH